MGQEGVLSSCTFAYSCVFQSHLIALQRLFRFIDAYPSVLSLIRSRIRRPSIPIPETMSAAVAYELNPIFGTPPAPQ